VRKLTVSETGTSLFLARLTTNATELPQNAETGAPRADASDREKEGVKLAKMLNYTYKPFWRSEAAAAKPKISFFSNVPLRGCGGSRK